MTSKEELQEQYRTLAEIIESEGLGYALTRGGYITPDMTDDPELKEAIAKAIEGCNKIEEILEPYLY